MLPRRLNESTFAVMQPDTNRIPRQVSLRDRGPEWRSIGRLRETRTARNFVGGRERASHERLDVENVEES